MNSIVSWKEVLNIPRNVKFSMDILLDVVAIRLDGGFWTWVGNPINLEISQHTFLSVIWVNFLGYMIETPTVVLLTGIKQKRVAPDDFKKQTIGMFLIAAGSIIVTGAGSLAALGLNALTDDWFSCLAFASLWLFMAAAMIRQAFTIKLKPADMSEWDWPMIIFWLAMYVYCILAMVHLGLTVIPWFMIMGGAFTAATIYVSISK